MSMQTHVPQALADLEARAGASDQDREQWLLERRAGVTATEVRDLANGKIRAQDLVDLKLGRKTDGFHGNAYTEWGQLREPIIAATLIGLGIEPESRVFHHAENSRHLASPDGVGVDFTDEIVLSEIKTCGTLLPLGSPELDAKGYLDQIQWCMHVTGAIRCALVVEERLYVRDASEGESVFEPGQRTVEWVGRDEKRIAELVKIADDFLAEVDRQRVEGAPVIDEQVDTHAVNYLRASDEVKKWTALKEEHYAAVVAAGISQESDMARVTITPGKPDSEYEDTVVDLDAAAAAHPKETAALARAKARVVKLQAEWDALAHAHTKTVIQTVKGTKARATITAGKGLKGMSK